MNITDAIKDGNFDASMFSINALISGDPQYFYGITLTRDALYNYSKTTVPGADALFAQLRDEPDPAKRQVFSRQMHEAVQGFVPNLYLAAAPWIVAYRKGKVRGFVLHPNDLYLFNTAISVS